MQKLLTALFSTCARLIWGFKFAPTDPDSLPDASLETGYTAGFNIRPYPFSCSILPRSSEIKETMLKEKDGVVEGLRKFET